MHKEHRASIDLEKRLEAMLDHGGEQQAMYSPAMLSDLFFSRSIDYSRVPIKRIALACSEVSGITINDSTLNKPFERVATPEIDALLFYVSTQYLSLVSDKHAKYELIRAHEDRELIPKVLLAQTRLQLRSLFYLTVICTRESRHSHYKGDAMTAHLKKAFAGKKEFTSAVIDDYVQFFVSIRHGGSQETAQRFYDIDSELTFGQYIQCVSENFNTEFSNAYGGKAWHNIAKCVERAVLGETSLHTMTDTSYTLAHNTGAIFNKGFIYHKQVNHRLLKILDLQRAGALPQGMKSGYLEGASCTHTNTEEDKVNLRLLKKLVDRIYALTPDLPVEVNWKEVIAHGAVGKYTHRAKAQKTTPMSNMPKGFKFKDTLTWHAKKPKLIVLQREST